jgi:hypothetical protein
LESELTEDGIEGLAGKRQCTGVGLPPLDRRARRSLEGSGDGNHPGVEVGRDDRSALAHLLGRDARHDAGAAGEVEHAFLRPEIC